MKKYSVIILFTLFMLPSIAFASWWNPFSWFRKTPNIPVTVQPAVTPSVEKKSEIKPTSSLVNKPTVASQKSTQKDLDDISKVLMDESMRLVGYLSDIVDIGNSMAAYPSDYSVEVLNTSAKLSIISDDIKDYQKEILTKREEILKTGYVDKRYWTTYGIPDLAAKDKQFLQKITDITKEFNSNVKVKRSSISTYNYYTPTTSSYSASLNNCAQIEQDIRDGITKANGLASESQIQALLRNKGC